MDSGWTQELLAWLQANPAWGAVIVLLIAFFESLVLIGILLPGMLIVFGIGALVGLGVLDLAPIWIFASIGALMGDSFSYFLGRRYREALVDVWPFSRYPGMIERGTEYFHNHGAKSVVAGRFIGPLRPIIPAVAGMLGMRPLRFIAVDVAACILWAPALLLPGVLFGTSLEVASQYTGRLAWMLIILLVLLWITWWAIRSVYEPLASRSARWVRHAIRWNRRHPVLGRITGPLIDPSRPEAVSVAMTGILLVLVFWVLLMLLFLSPFSAQPEALDLAVRDLALSLRNHLADPVMVALSQLSRWQVSVFSALALLLWLLGAGRVKAALHWMIAIIGGAILHLILSWGLRRAPEVLELEGQVLGSPSAAMSLVTVVLTFFAVVEAGELARKNRQWPYLVAAVLILLLGTARIYLGLEWLSGALVGVVSGLAWVAVIGFAYRQRATRHFSGGVASLIFYGAFTALFAWQVNEHAREDIAALQSTTVLREIAAEDWWRSEWSTLSTNRSRASSIAETRFTLQVAAEPERVSELLSGDGWEQVPDTDWRWVLQALNPEADPVTLPLLGRAYQGSPEVLLLRKTIGEQELVTLRLWDSGVRLQPGSRVLYLGQVVEEVLVQRFGSFSYWRAVPARESLAGTLRENLSALDQRVLDNDLLLLRDPVRPGPFR